MFLDTCTAPTRRVSQISDHSSLQPGSWVIFFYWIEFLRETSVSVSYHTCYLQQVGGWHYCLYPSFNPGSKSKYDIYTVWAQILACLLNIYIFSSIGSVDISRERYLLITENQCLDWILDRYLDTVCGGTVEQMSAVHVAPQLLGRTGVFGLELSTRLCDYSAHRPLLEPFPCWKCLLAHSQIRKWIKDLC